MANYIIRNGELYRTDELYHYGILGMKWGVRRYQNPDGTLTAAGRKRLQKQDKTYTKRHPDRAKKASELREDVIEAKKKMISNVKTEMIEDQKKAKNIEDYISKTDFEKEAHKQLSEELRFLKETYKNGYGGKQSPTIKDAIDSFYASLGMDTPKGATVKDVANIIKNDTEQLAKNKTFDKLVELDKKTIAQGERIVRSISEMSLEDIYKNQHDIHYTYWKNRGYYD